MTTITIQNPDITLRELAKQIGIQPVIIIGEGMQPCAVIPLSDEDYETIALADNPDFMAIIEQSRQRLAAEGGITLEDAYRQLGLAV